MNSARIGWIRAVAVRTLALAVAWPAGASLAAQASDLSPHFEPLAFLVGSCWRGGFADGKTVDVRCVEPVFGGRFLRERHVVRGGGDRVYRGETLYHWDAKTGRIGFTYWNSDGGISTGTMDVDGARRVFPAERYTDSKGRTRELRTTWLVEGDSAWVMSTEERGAGGQWAAAWRIAFRRDPSAKVED
jgi:hypothetical protein